ncbi:unnamed protein product [Musa acuminata subsp. malaccensis]|uniref:(wild Malaysian banana) hypothetical protein n=1 Tax=Musa acuminata subsp. malaccensis TaxID=214687 RepID=A0A8D7FHE2_MUSAM|nr:unnamed protein product [Musa acuminata subsp. malaccensis]
MSFTGFQASNLGDAIDIVSQMIDWRLSHEAPADDCNEGERDPAYRNSVECKIFLGFTSNLVSSGIRQIIRFLLGCRFLVVEVLVTTAGGIEEDLIKCLAPTYKGDFSLPGDYLCSEGLNKIGNLLVPNDKLSITANLRTGLCQICTRCYMNSVQRRNILHLLCLMKMHGQNDDVIVDQSLDSKIWTPSKVIVHLGKEINDESSYLYWAYKNGVSLYCPA